MHSSCPHLISFIDIRIDTMADHLLHQQRMGLITNLWQKQKHHEAKSPPNAIENNYGPPP